MSRPPTKKLSARTNDQTKRQKKNPGGAASADVKVVDHAENDERGFGGDDEAGDVGADAVAKEVEDVSEAGGKPHEVPARHAGKPQQKQSASR